MLRTSVLLLGNHIRVTIRTNTRCGTSNIPHTPTGNKWFSESISGLLGQPVPTSTVYPIPVRAPSCSRTISGLLYEQIPAAGNQSSRTHNASLSQNIHIRVALRRYILSEGNARAGVLLLGNNIRVTLRTNTRCGKSNIPHTTTRPSIKPTTQYTVQLNPTSSRSGPSGRGVLSK
jgi:hypothetical protein